MDVVFFSFDNGQSNIFKEISMETSKARIAYLDNLRTFVIFLVVVMHSNVTYSGFGGWYYKEIDSKTLDLLSKILFGLYGSFTQAWFMGILFFIGGYFASRSLEKRGTAGFVRERLFRLGLPLLVFAFLLQPLIVYFLVDFGHFFRTVGFLPFYGGYLAGGWFLGGTGPLWFVEVLLVFCLIYAAVRFFAPKAEPKKSVPRTTTLLLLAAVTGVVAFLIRLFWPIGTDFLNLQFCYFASYITLFILGVHSGEAEWFTRVSDRVGLNWFWAIVGIGLPSWFALMILGGARTGVLPINGGFFWQSFAFAIWEAFVAVFFSLGLVTFFRRYLNYENKATRLLANCSFGIYMFHPPVLIGISLALAGLAWPALGKHLLVAPLAWGATLVVASLLRKTPGVRAVVR